MLSKNYIKKVAREMLSKGDVTNFDVQYELARRLGRELTPGEKRKVTQMLKLWFDYEVEVVYIGGVKMRAIRIRRR